MSKRSSETSPTLRKRGSVPETTTGSRAITSFDAWPTFVPLQATAMTRMVPLKAGISKSTEAVPSAATRTMPE